jgi:hypothetical protein
MVGRIDGMIGVQFMQALQERREIHAGVARTARNSVMRKLCISCLFLSYHRAMAPRMHRDSDSISDTLSLREFRILIRGHRPDFSVIVPSASVPLLVPRYFRQESVVPCGQQLLRKGFRRLPGGIWRWPCTSFLRGALRIAT